MKIKTKLVVEIEVKDVLELLHKAVVAEVPLGIKGCLQTSKAGLICCRALDHDGYHIALGRTEVYEIWSKSTLKSS